MFAINVNDAELQALAADPRVTRIHENALRQTKLIQSVPLVGVTAAYSAGATGSGRAVAILDTGVQSNHPFLSGKVILEACFSNSSGGGGGVSLCPNGASTQTGAGSASPASAGCQNGGTNMCYHGTHVAGIAAGNNTTPNNPVGSPSSGVAKGAQIVAIQIFTRFNSGCAPSSNPCIGAFDSDTLAGLDYVFSNMASLPGSVVLDALNMSLGGGSFTSPCDASPYKSRINNFIAAGAATVIAAGNDASTNAVESPGCVSTAVTVGSSDKSDVISGFSNMASMVDLMGPGGFGGGICQFGANNPDILSSIPTNQYACLAGTSMATPHVAGAFAALKSQFPSATVAQVLGALQSTGVAIVDNRSGGTQTKSRIRVDLALNQLSGLFPPADDNFANAATLSGQSGTTTGTNLGATLEAGEPPPFAGTGNHSVWWKWTAPLSGEVTFDTIGSNFNTVLSAYFGSAINALTLIAGNDDIGGGVLQSRITFRAQVGFTYYIRVDGFSPSDTGSITLNWSEPPTPSPLAAAVLPYARSVQIGQTATAFGVMINGGSSTATGCSLGVPAGFPDPFTYQTTNSSNQLTGSPNTPVDIPARGTQNFVFGYTPGSALNAVEIGMVFDCSNTVPVVSVPGVNTFILSAASTPTPDIIAIGVTPSGDGIVNIPGNTGTGFFAAAGINIGSTATITASADDGGRGLALVLTICQTDSGGNCMAPPAPSVTMSFANNASLTFSIFVHGAGNVPFDPAHNRLFLRFKDGSSVTRGATNVAVRTGPAS